MMKETPYLLKMGLTSIFSQPIKYFSLVSSLYSHILVYTYSGYSESDAFEFIDKIQNSGILEMIDDEGYLNHVGQLNLKDMFFEYENIPTKRIEPIDEVAKEDEHSHHQEEVQRKITNNKNIEIILNSSKQNINHIKIQNKKYDNKVLFRYWLLGVMFILCVLVYIIIPILRNLDEDILHKPKDDTNSDNQAAKVHKPL